MSGKYVKLPVPKKIRTSGSGIDILTSAYGRAILEQTKEIKRRRKQEKK